MRVRGPQVERHLVPSPGEVAGTGILPESQGPRTLPGAADQAEHRSMATNLTLPLSLDESVRPLHADVLLADGALAVVRTLEPGDGAMLHELHERVSDDAVRMRFFSVARRTAHAYVEHVLGSPDTLALAAEVRGRIVGLGDRRADRPPGKRGGVPRRRRLPGSGARHPPARASCRDGERSRDPPVRGRGAVRELPDARSLRRRRVPRPTPARRGGAGAGDGHGRHPGRAGCRGSSRVRGREPARWRLCSRPAPSRCTACAGTARG